MNDMNYENDMQFSEEPVNYWKRIKAKEKRNYWVECGKAFFNGDEIMQQKWIDFVDASVNGIDKGMLIDEMLQIMSMLELGVNLDDIHNIINQISEKEILKVYLGEFIHQDYLYSLESGFKK